MITLPGAGQVMLACHNAGRSAFALKLQALRQLRQRFSLRQALSVADQAKARRR